MENLHHGRYIDENKHEPRQKLKPDQDHRGAERLTQIIESHERALVTLCTGGAMAPATIFESV